MTYQLNHIDPDEIDSLRLKAFKTNDPHDTLTYYKAASAYFQDRHVREMIRAEAAEAALPAAYRLGRVDGWQGFVTDMAIRALSTEHAQDEKWLIDHAALLFQRDCDITRARKIRATQPTPTAAELLARIQTGEKE